MVQIYVSAKEIRQGSVELASLNKKERMKKERRRKSDFYHRLVQDVDDYF